MSSWYLGANARLSIPGQGSVNAELWARFVAAADSHYRAAGQRTQVNSVMRSTVDQRRFWNAYVRYLQGGPWAPLAARPGTSNHEKGRAIDAQPGGALATWGSPWQRAMTDHGLAFPVVGEPWHIELSPTRRPLPQSPIPQPPARPEEDIMASIDDLRRVVRDELGGLGGDTLRLALGIAPVGAYRDPRDGGMFMIGAADGVRIVRRRLTHPAQVAALQKARVIPTPVPDVDAKTADELAKHPLT